MLLLGYNVLDLMQKMSLWDWLFKKSRTPKEETYLNVFSYSLKSGLYNIL